MANHGPLCKRIELKKETSSNQLCGRHSDVKWAFLKFFSICATALSLNVSCFMHQPFNGVVLLVNMFVGVSARTTP